ncbi:MAG: ATP-binding protein [Lachnospiraceae bacterium]
MSSSKYIKIEEFKKGIEELERGYDSVMNHLYDNRRFDRIYPEQQKFVYFKIDELAYSDDKEGIEEVVCALYSIGVSFSIVFKCEKGKLHIYIGTKVQFVNTIYDVLNGSFWVCSEQLEKKDGYEEFISNREIFNIKYAYSGVIRGGIKIKEKEVKTQPVIDAIMSGIRGKDFSIVIVARPFARQDIITLLNEWSELKTRGEIIKSRQVSYHDNLHQVSYTDMSHKVMNYIELIEKYFMLYNGALGKGLWESCIKYYANDEIVLNAVSGIIISKIFTDKSPEIAHSIKVDNMNYNDDLLINRINVSVDDGPPMQFSEYSTFITSEELSVLIELPKEDGIGIPVRENVKFDLAQKNCGDIILGNILQSKRSTNSYYTMDSNELNRHALIVGLTGGGKTNTIKSLLLEVNQKRNIPFLVIEPAKKEYWELYKLGCNDLTVYSFDNDNMVHINPFQRIGSITVQMHIDYLFAAFKASFIMYPPMPYVLERAIYEVYYDCGWDVANDYNSLGEVYPTVEQLYYKIPHVVEKMGYDFREQKNIIGALQARINSLRLGIKGQCLNVKESTYAKKLFEKNTIIELEGIADEETKAFIMSLIMVQLMEYRMNEIDSQKELKHLFLMEEAHRLLKNISSGTGENADPRGNAVEMFCNMLAELRSKGQGFVIADQIPSKLAPDIVKNTNLKIVHRIVDEEDRRLVGNSMHMNENQIHFISNLTQGQGIIYSENDNEPKMILSPYANKYIDRQLLSHTHKEVLQLCRPDRFECRNEKEKSVFCGLCPFVCDGRKSKIIYSYVGSEELAMYVNEILKSYSDDMIIAVISECLLDIRESKGEDHEIWKYAFCIANELCFLLETNQQQTIGIFRLVLKTISCMSGAPKVWRDDSI